MFETHVSNNAVNHVRHCHLCHILLGEFVHQNCRCYATNVYLFISMSCAPCLRTWCSLKRSIVQNANEKWPISRMMLSTDEQRISTKYQLAAISCCFNIRRAHSNDLSFKSMLSEIRKWISAKLLWKLVLNADCDDLQGCLFILPTENWFSHVENHTVP